MEETKKYSTWQLIRIFWPYLNKHKAVMFFDLFCAGMSTLAELVLPVLLRKLTNQAINDMASLTISFVLNLSAIYFVLRIISLLANYYMIKWGHIMGAMIETDMRSDVFHHLQKLSNNYYNNTKVGKIMARITSDLFDITEFAHHCPEEYFIGLIQIVVSFVILLGINIPLTLVLFTMIPIMIWASTKYRLKMKEGFRDLKKQIGELNSDIEDSLLGIRVVKAFTNEEKEIAKFEKGNQRFLEIKKDLYGHMAGFFSITRGFNGLMYVTVMLLGGVFMMQGTLLAGDMLAYVMYVNVLLVTVRRIVEFSEQFQKGITGIERFAEIMDKDIEIFDEPGAIEVKNVQGEIEFSKVSFRYEKGNEDVLTDLNLKIKKGENLALVGPSGAGKTTICNLIPRFYEVSSGKILLDGQNINQITLKSLRQSIGIVQQDVYLFSGTIYENIVYGKLNATREEVVEASRLAGIYDFIMGLPQDFDTYVGERGVKLSGGQKQRISIARVFLKNPPILILDEATSALDNESERIIQESLERLSKGRTTLTIAHRLTTIKKADRILVLTENGIAEEGNHEDLMAKKQLYYQLYTKKEWEG